MPALFAILFFYLSHIIVTPTFLRPLLTELKMPALRIRLDDFNGKRLYTGIFNKMRYLLRKARIKEVLRLRTRIR